MMGRYVRAFITALRLTLRGEQTPAQQASARYPLLLGWCAETVRRVDAFQAACDRDGFDAQSRAAAVRHLDGRDMNLQTVLNTLRFHVAREYPHLLAHEGKYALLAVQATHLNDRFYLTGFLDADALSGAAVQGLNDLIDHLNAMPSDAS